MITYQQVQDGFNLDLQDFSNILPEKHRDSEQRMLDYLFQFVPLHSGSFHLGDVPEDNLYNISIPDVGTSNYYVIGSLRSNGASYNNDNDVIWCFRNTSATNFQLAIRAISNNPQDLTFFYEIKKIIV